MRQPLRPLILILILLGFGFSGHALETKSSLSNFSSVADNTAFPSLVSPAINTLSGVENGSEAFVMNTPMNGTMYFQQNGPGAHQFWLFEENSYNSNKLPLSEAHIFSENASSVQEEASNSQGVLFRQGMFYGFALMLVLLNMVCYFLFEEKAFLSYSLAIGSLGVVFFYVDGLPTLLGMELYSEPQLIQSTLLLIATFFGASFASRYLSLAEFFPKLKFVTTPLLGVASLLVVLAWSASAPVLANIANIAMYMVMASYFVAGVILFSRKNYVKFYVIAYSIPLLFAVDFFVLRNLGVEFLFTESAHIKAAVLVEMLILTYAIMYRMRAIKEENQLRQTELRIFLKRQEAMNRRSAEKLLEDVYLENLIMHYDLDGLEIKLLQYISEGKNNAKIARKLKVTELDVEDLTKDLYEKLEISEHIQEDFRMVDSQPDYIYN